MNFVALRIIPEAQLCVAVEAVYLPRFARYQASVHVVRSQQTLIAGVPVEEKSKPKYD